VTSDAGSGIVQRSGARRHLPSLEFKLPAAMDARQRDGRSKVGPVAGLAMYAAALWLAFENDTFRRLEAAAITPVADLVTGRHHAVATRTIVFFGLGTSHAFGLDITNECTSALLLIPLLVMMGSFATFTRLSMRRQIVALFVGSFLIVAVNAVRVASIAWATWEFGYDPGYTYSHVFVGSAFSLVGFVGAMLVALWILVRTQRVKQEPDAPVAHRAASTDSARAQRRGRSAHRHRRR
jgi:exosortase/archaeosortase family protein